MKIRQSPLERLHTEKRRVESQYRQQEEQLNADWNYIREHSGSLLFSGICALLFPKDTPGSTSPDSGENDASGFSGYQAVIKAFLPMAWGMVKPLLISWVLRKAGVLVEYLFKKESDATA